MAQTFFCIETGNSLYGGTVRRFFDSPAAVMSFLKATRDGWNLWAAEWDNGELVPTWPITDCLLVDKVSLKRPRKKVDRARVAAVIIFMSVMLGICILPQLLYGMEAMQ